MYKIGSVPPWAASTKQKVYNESPIAACRLPQNNRYAPSMAPNRQQANDHSRIEKRNAQNTRFTQPAPPPPAQPCGAPAECGALLHLLCLLCLLLLPLALVTHVLVIVHLAEEQEEGDA